MPLAEHLCDLGRPEEAEKVCRRGLATMPAHHRGYMSLARALCDRGRLKEAQDVLAELAKHRPDDADVWVHLGAVVIRRGDRPRACALLDYAESLGAAGPTFEAARQLARKPVASEAPTSAPAVKLGGRATPLGPDDRPPPVSGVLVAKGFAVHEATQLVPRRRSAPLALAAAALLTLILVGWLLLRG